jgi:hypothetical protein
MVGLFSPLICVGDRVADFDPRTIARGGTLCEFPIKEEINEPLAWSVEV